MECRVARYHNIFGPEGSWNNGKEKVPAAICRKVSMARHGGEIEIWGDGLQTRSFLYIDECLEGTVRLARSWFEGPVNIGSTEMVSINQLAHVVCDIAGKKLQLRHIPGPLGVRGRNSDNRLIRDRLGWGPSEPLRAGLERTYAWVDKEVLKLRGSNTAGGSSVTPLPKRAVAST
jgi:nucleoside-diphosphate-sugar epimerase